MDPHSDAKAFAYDSDDGDAYAATSDFVFYRLVEK